MNKKREPKRYTQTVCFLCRDGSVLLPEKTRKIGKGKRNGYGGNIKPYETIPACALRELWEESGGVIATHDALEKIAVATIYSTDKKGSKMVVYLHAFVVRNWQGEPRESEEMRDPRWFPINQLPIDELMPSDKHWLTLALSGNKLIVEAHLGQDQKTCSGATLIRYVDMFPY